MEWVVEGQSESLRIQYRTLGLSEQSEALPHVVTTVLFTECWCRTLNIGSRRHCLATSNNCRQRANYNDRIGRTTILTTTNGITRIEPKVRAETLEAFCLFCDSPIRSSLLYCENSTKCKKGYHRRNDAAWLLTQPDFDRHEEFLETHWAEIYSEIIGSQSR